MFKEIYCKKCKTKLGKYNNYDGIIITESGVKIEIKSHQDVLNANYSLQYVDVICPCNFIHELVRKIQLC